MEKNGERLQSALDGARERLACLEEKTAFRAALFTLLLLFAFALMWRLTALTPLMMDDYDYSVSWSTGELVSDPLDVLDRKSVV